MFSKKQIVTVFMLGTILILAACAPGEAGIPVTGGTATPGKPSSSPELHPQVVLNAQQWLATQLNVAVDQIRIVEFEQAEWSDSCLGLGRLDESCLQAITPGWRVVLEVNGVSYEIRTDETASVIRLAPSAGASENNLENSHWRLVTFGSLTEGQAVLDGSTITLTLANGQAGGFGGCNTYGSTYQVDGDTISFGEVTSTLRACEAENLTEQESRYFEALRSAARFEWMDNLLTFLDESGNELLTFETPISIAPQ